MDKRRKELIRMWVIAYVIFLCIIFIFSPYLKVVEFHKMYNITCPSGEVELFNYSTEEVCGMENPLHIYPSNDYKYEDIKTSLLNLLANLISS